MTPIETGIIALVVFFFLLALGLPIGYGMIAVGVAGIWYLISDSAAIAKLGVVPYSTVHSYDLSVLPLFLLMAHVIFAAGLSKDLYNLAATWLGHRPGGLAMATIGGCAGFAAMSASSIATVVTMGLVALPEMKRYNYDPALSTGAVAAGGTIGILIPPSGLLIIYGILTETSIGRLFIAGIVPGCLEALFYMITIYILCIRNPRLGPRGPQTSLKEKIWAFRSCGEMVALILLVLGGLIIGWFTPTEAGAVGAFGAIVFSLVRKRLNWQGFRRAVADTVKTTGMIYLILIGAFMFQYFIAVTTIPVALADFVSGLPLPPLGTMGIVLIVYFFLGCFLDAMAMVLLTIPIFFPLSMNLGFDPVWFGIIIVRVSEIAMITPPIGMNVYALSGVVPDVPTTTVFRGVLPFVMADLCHVALLLFVPAVVLFLPNLMY
jgi:C4-dicarboxylate transporter DctM subunit